MDALITVLIQAMLDKVRIAEELRDEQAPGTQLHTYFKGQADALQEVLRLLEGMADSHDQS